MLYGHQGRLRGLSYAPDGGRLASASEDGTVRVWPVASAGDPLVLKVHTGSAEALTFLPDGRLVTGAADGTVAVWDVTAGRKLAGRRAHEGGVRHLACAPGRPLVVSAGWDRTLKSWEFATVRKRLPQPGELSWEDDLEIGGLAFRDADTLAVGGCFSRGEVGEAGVYFLDLKEEDKGFGPLDQNIRALACSADGRWCAVSDPGREVLCESTSGKTLTFPDHGCILALAFLPGPSRVLAGGSDGAVRLYALGDEVEELRAFTWHDDWVTCLAVSPDGMTAAAGYEDGCVAVWDLADL
jgi:WD40 repeat protein